VWHAWFMFPLNQISPLTSLIGFVIGLPTAAATYYQAWKTRKEAAQARAGLSYSKNCLEFVLEDGSSVNLVPLDSLQTMPQPGEIVLLPGSGLDFGGGPGPGGYRGGAGGAYLCAAGGAWGGSEACAVDQGGGACVGARGGG
jgi:hypothetical protein